MERRGFIRGLFGGIVGSGIVVTASPEEIAQFASPLSAGAPIVAEAPDVMPVGCGDHLYNDRGELVAIVTHIHGVLSNRMTISAESVGGGIQMDSDRVRLRNPTK